MAKVHSSNAVHSNNTTVNELLCPLSVFSAGYLGVVVLSSSANTGPAWQQKAGTTGWTLVQSATVGTDQDTHAIFWKFLSGAEADPIFQLSGGSVGYSDAIITIVKSAHAVPIITHSIAQSNKTGVFNMDTVNTAGYDDALILATCMGRSDIRSFSFPAQSNSYASAYKASNSIGATWYYQQTGGTTASVPVLRGGTWSENVGQVLVAIRDDGTGDITGHVNPTSTPATMLNAGLYNHAGSYSINIAVPTLEGDTLINTGGNTAPSNPFSPIDNYPVVRTHTSNSTNPNSSGAVFYNATEDLSDSLLQVLMAPGTYDDPNTWENGGRYLLLGSGATAAGKAWKIEAKDTKLTVKAGSFPYIIDTSMASYETHGAFDVTDVTGWGFAIHRNGTSNTTFGYLNKLGTLELTYGNSDNPCSFSDAARQSRLSGLYTVQSQSGQAKSQFYINQNIQIGNNGVNAVHFAGPNQAVEFAGKYDIDKRFVHHQISTGRLKNTILGGVGDVIDLSSMIFNMGDEHQFILDSNVAISSTGLVILTSTFKFLNNGGVALGSVRFIGCNALEMNTNSLAGGCIIALSKAPQVVTSESDFQKYYNCSFVQCPDAIQITGDQTGTWSDPNITMDGNVIDIEYTGDTSFIIESELAIGVTNSGSGVLTVQTPTVTQGVNFTGLKAGTQVVIYEQGTTTEIDRVNSSTTSFQWDETYSSDRSVDYTIQQTNYLPIHVTNIPLSDSVVPVAVQQVPDRSHQTSSGLAYGTTCTITPGAKTIAVTAGTTVQNLYSALIEFWIAQSALRNIRFPVVTNGPNSFTFENDWELTPGSFAFLSQDGVRYTDTGENNTAVWAAIFSAGETDGLTGRFQQVEAAAPVNAKAAGDFDELIQVFGDVSHGNFDYTTYLTLKFQSNGYEEAVVDVPGQYGVLEDSLYVIAMQPAPLPTMVLGDPGVTGLSLTNHGNSPVTWNSLDFSITITDTNNNSGEDIWRWLNYHKSLSATFQGEEPFNLFDMVLKSGSAFETRIGEIIGSAGAVAKGVRIVDGSNNPHPDFLRMQADDGSYWAPTPVFGLTINDLIAGSQVYIYDTGTTNELSDTQNSGTSFVYSGNYTVEQIVDYTVIKPGYFPIQVIGVTLNDSAVSQSVDMKVDRAYEASSGLTFGTTATANTSTKIFAVTEATTVQNWYSFMIEAWRDEAALQNIPFPLTTNGPNSITLNDDYEFTVGSIPFLSRDGLRYVDASEQVTAVWAAVLSQGEAGTLQATYQQVEGTGKIATNTTGIVDQLIQVFGDSDHGDFDYTGHLVIKMIANGYLQARADVVGTFGTLADQFYVIGLAPTALPDLALGDPSIADLSITDHGASPVNWNSKDFSITITDAGATSGEDIVRWINYHLSLVADFEGKPSFNWFDMVIDNGAAYETITGTMEGDAGATIKGVRVLRGGNAHPDFTRFKADDGTYYNVPITANATISNIVAGSRVFIYNATTDTVMYNGVPGTSYAASYTEGIDYTNADIVEIQITQAGAATAHLPLSIIVIATTNGWSALANQLNNPIYAQLGIDGFSINKFFADYVNSEVDLTISAHFTGAELYAWWVANETTAQGIANFFGGFVAEDAANFRFITSIVDAYLDNDTDGNKRQTDNVRIYRDDEIYPVRDVTTSGFGIDVNWRDKVFIAVTGSGVTAQDKADIKNLVFDEIITNSETLKQYLQTMNTGINAATAADLTGVEASLASIIEATITNAAGTDVSADIAAVQSTLVNILQDTGTDIPALIAALKNFDPENDTVQHVALVDLTTENADQASTEAPNNVGIASIESKIDGISNEMTAVKAKTDSLTFTKNNEIDSNNKSVNDITVKGTGTESDPWVPDIE